MIIPLLDPLAFISFYFHHSPSTPSFSYSYAFLVLHFLPLSLNLTPTFFRLLILLLGSSVKEAEVEDALQSNYSADALQQSVLRQVNTETTCTLTDRRDGLCALSLSLSVSLSLSPYSLSLSISPLSPSLLFSRTQTIEVEELRAAACSFKHQIQTYHAQEKVIDRAHCAHYPSPVQGRSIYSP